MKKSFFASSCIGLWERSRRLHLPAWIGFHLLLFAGFALGGRPAVDSDLSSILPQSSPAASVGRAEKKLSAELNGSFSVLLGHRDFRAARQAASALAAGLRGHPSLAAVSLEVDDSLPGRLQEFFFQNRYRCLPPETLQDLEAGRIDLLAAEAFQVVSSPLSVGALRHIELDPFLLAHRSLQRFLGSGLAGSLSVGVKDGVLAAEHEGRWYVLVGCRLEEGGVNTRTRGHAVPVVYSLAERLQKEIPGLELVYTGVPFHAFQSASQAQREIALISVAATAILICIVALLFFSLMPLGATFLTMGLGIAAGLAASFLAFRQVHLFTIVFGTSLIGISVDYAVVFFAEWLNPREPRLGPAIIRRTLPGITIGLLSTLLSYLILLFAPFPLLRQMAVFSSVGLASTFLSVVCVFPRLRPPRLPRRNIPIRVLEALLAAYDRFFAMRSWLRWSLLALAGAAALVGLARVRPVNELRAIYRVSPRLAASEAKAAAILELGASGLYCILRGADSEEVLRREEALTARLDREVAEGRLGGYLATSTLLPSHARQELTYRLVGSALLPRAGGQLAALGFDAGALAQLWEDYRRQAGAYLESAQLRELSVSPLAGSLWIGEVQGESFSAVLLLRVRDAASLAAMVGGLPGATLVNKTAELGQTLQRLSSIALLLIAAAYALIFLGLWRLYDLPTAGKLIAVPVAASLLTVAILGYAGLPLNLFAIVGLILIPGIGSDYAVFYEEGHERRSVTMLAVTLSLASTVTSFGALAFSSLAGVFGLTVTLGVTLSFLLAPLAARRLGA